MALLAIVMVHRVMHGSVILLLRTSGAIDCLVLIIGCVVTAGSSQILKVIVLLPHHILVAFSRMSPSRRVTLRLHSLAVVLQASLRATSRSLRMQPQLCISINGRIAAVQVEVCTGRLRNILSWYSPLIIVKFEFSRFFILCVSVATRVFYRAGCVSLPRIHAITQSHILLLEAAAFRTSLHLDLVLDALTR